MTRPTLLSSSGDTRPSFARDGELADVRGILRDALNRVIVGIVPAGAGSGATVHDVDNLLDLLQDIDRSVCVHATGARVSAQLAVAYPSSGAKLAAIGRRRARDIAIDDLVAEILNQYLGAMADYIPNIARDAKMSPPVVSDISAAPETFFVEQNDAAFFDPAALRVSWVTRIAMFDFRLCCYFAVQETGKDQRVIAQEIIRSRQTAQDATGGGWIF